MTKAGNKRRRLDLTTLAGVCLGIGLVLVGHALEDGKLGSLIQGAAALIVFGGTAGAVFVSFPLHEVRRAFASLRHVVVNDEPDPNEVLQTIGRFSLRARKEGLLALEDEADRIAFASALVALGARETARVIVTLRDDFLVRAAQLPPLAKISAAIQILTTPPSRVSSRTVSSPVLATRRFPFASGRTW